MDRQNSKIVNKVTRNFYKDETIARDDIKRIFRKIDQLPVTNEFKSKIELIIIDVLVAENEIQNFPDIFLEINRTDLQAFLIDQIAKTRPKLNKIRL
jgi:hypothetical protein